MVSYVCGTFFLHRNNNLLKQTDKKYRDVRIQNSVAIVCNSLRSISKNIKFRYTSKIKFNSKLREIEIRCHNSNIIRCCFIENSSKLSSNYHKINNLTQKDT